VFLIIIVPASSFAFSMQQDDGKENYENIKKTSRRKEKKLAGKLIVVPLSRRE
jgi:hypothetical protein